MGCPAIAILTKNLTFTIQCLDSEGQAIAPTGNVNYAIYEDTTSTSIKFGTMSRLGSLTGLYAATVAITAASGFEAYKSYTIRITATVDTKSLVRLYSFTVIGADSAAAAVSSGSLTTLSNIKEYLGLSADTYDTLLTNLQARAVKFIQNFTGRTLISGTYREFIDTFGVDNEIVLKERPITNIDYVSIDRTAAVQIINSSSDAYRAGVRIDDTDLANPTMTLEVYGGANDGYDSITLSNYSTMSLFVSAINSLGKGWTADLLSDYYGNYDPIELLPEGRLDCFNNYAYFCLPEEFEDEYRSDNERGIIYLNSIPNRGVKKVIVKYTAGYSTIPADLEMACIELVKYWFDKRKISSNITSESIGDYSYSSGNLTIDRPMFKTLTELLAPYVSLSKYAY